MERRSFLTTATLATAGIGTFLVSSCSNKEKTGEDGLKEEGIDDFVLDEETISSLSTKLKSGEYTSEKLVELYLKRIEEIDKKGPALNAVIEVNPDALNLAKKLDKELKEGKSRGLLHGIPVLIKDNIDTADQMQTTAGALALEGNIAKDDAYIVKRLRAAGAIILGKTNLSEWANFRSTSSCSGWSSRGGQTKNPYILDHNPCGSSAGSGVAVSANLCTVSVGTETDGSVVCPSSVSGAVGIKPTIGLVSRSGIIPISSTQDTAGPMARTVQDAAILLGVLAGSDNNDKSTIGSKQTQENEYVKYLDKNFLSGKRIGVEKKQQGANQFMHALQKKSIDLIRRLGGTVVEIDYLDAINELGAAEFEVMQFEFKEGVNSYLKKSDIKVKSLKDVIDFNLKNEDKAMPYFKQETLISSNEKGDLADAKYKEALKNSHFKAIKILNKVIDENKLDAICGLTMGPACSIDMIYGDRWGDVFLTSPAAISGFPHITVPCGTVYDLPVGFSFFGKPFTEPELIGFAYAFEQASNSRVKPSFKKAFLG
ncbi:amidase [Flavobacterium sp.]|uniref:amidase n=1 Tax=Flavobacterium sp. TaxID=239 RepID=UPI00262C7BD2|nr:amidase [Flavobacterium sp.]MDG2433574.1 amidase [Flavobacterium sp.]